MQEEAVPISEEEASDSEIMMISQQRQSMSQQTAEQRAADRHLRSQEKLLDNQLKALGLYEEGLSYEQKEELLAVVAASRETAEQEESMRLQAKEWQQKVFPNDVEFPPAAETSVHDKNRAPSPTQVEDSMQLLNIEEDSPETPAGSGNSYDLAEMDDVPSKDTEDQASSIVQSEETGEILIRRGLSRRGRGRRPVSRGRCSTGSLKVSPVVLVSTDPEIGEQEMQESSDDPQVGHRKQKKDLEKFMPDWKPCISPDTELLTDKRLLCEEDSEDSPETTDEETTTESFGDSIDEFHTSLDEFQRTSGAYVPWGQPVTVGRPYATRGSRVRIPDSENSEGVLSFQSPGLSDDAFQVDEICSERYLQQYDKLFHQSLDSSGMNSTNTITPMSIASLLGDAMMSIQQKRTETKSSQDKVETETVAFIEQKTDDEGACNSPASDNSIVFSDFVSAPSTSFSNAAGSDDRGLAYYAETVTHLQPASSDESSIDIETCESDLPVRKDGTKTYSAQKLSEPVSESAICEIAEEAIESLENSVPENGESSPRNCLSPQSQTESTNSVKRKWSTTTGQPKVSSSPSKRLKESVIASEYKDDTEDVKEN